MWSIVPLTAFCVLWYGCYQYFLNGSIAFFITAAIWGGTVFVLTESLSFFHALSFFPLLIGWSLFLAAVIGWACPRWQWPQWKNPFLIFSQWALVEKALFLFIVGIVMIKGFSAWVSAPNTADAMSYHLSRIEHWIQDASLTHYPTHILRQLYYPVGAEYIVMHLMILSGGDHLANLVQWFACVGSLVAVYGLAALLGCDRRGQLLAVFLAVTLPMGLVQATSTQTDYVLTFWLAGFVYLLWNLYQQPRLALALGSGICLGLALLTKGNAYIYAPIWLLIYAAAGLRTPQRQRHGVFLVLMILVALLFSFSYGMRNIKTFGNASLPAASLTNATISPSIIGSSLLQNLRLHVGTLKPSTGEDDAGNGVYVLIFLIVLVAMALHPRLRNQRYWTYAGALFFMFVFFCTVVRFQPWNSRFHLSIFVLSCPLAAAVLSYLIGRWVILAAAVVFACCWPWLMVCNEHPFLGPKSILATSRVQQYFSERPDLILPYVLTVHGVQSLQCRDIGLIEGVDSWEYPWWVLLHEVYGQGFRLENVDVHNESAHLDLPKGAFDPCVLIAEGDSRTSIVLPEGRYLRAWFIDLPQGLTSIFIKDH